MMDVRSRKENRSRRLIEKQLTEINAFTDHLKVMYYKRDRERIFQDLFDKILSQQLLVTHDGSYIQYNLYSETTQGK